MPFEIRVDGEVVHTLEVDNFLVDAVIINGSDRVPTRGANAALGLDLTFDYKSATDGELVERLNNAAAELIQEDLDLPEKKLSPEAQKAEDEKTAYLEELGRQQEEAAESDASPEDSVTDVDSQKENKETAEKAASGSTFGETSSKSSK
jgi:hypothetical protein